MVDALARCDAEWFNGQRCHRLRLPQGDQVLVAEQGAHVLSWQTGGQERLFLSSANRWDGRNAIRGGVPLCFPQFNLRGSLPKHGMARNVSWQLGDIRLASDSASLEMRWQDDADTRAVWPHAFQATLQVDLTPTQLTLSFGVRNCGDTSLQFTGALHTYLAVDDVAQTALHGLAGQSEWDAIADVQGHAKDPLRFTGAFDRVYSASAEPLVLQEGDRRVCIEQSSSWQQHVVWNPGAQGCAALPDMPADGYSRMLCVEAAQVFAPITVSAGQQWHGWQRLTVL